MSTRQFKQRELLRLIDEHGGKSKVIATMRAIDPSLSYDAARKQLGRAETGPLGVEICSRILTALGVRRAEHEEYLEPDANGRPSFTPDSELARTFQLRVDVAPADGEALVMLDERTEAYTNGCLVTLSMINTGTAPLNVVGLRLSHRASPMADEVWFRGSRRKVGTGGVVMVPKSYVSLSRDKYEGRWDQTVSGHQKVLKFDSTTGDLFKSLCGQRLMFKVAPSDQESVDFVVNASGAFQYSFALSALAIDVYGDRVCRRTDEITLTDASSINGR